MAQAQRNGSAGPNRGDKEPPEGILTLEEAANWLRLSPSQVYELTRKRCRRPLPCLRAGKVLRFRLSSIDSKMFPKLADLPYEKAHAITQDVSNHVLDLVNKESGGHIIDSVYGPGGWHASVSPSAQTNLLSSPEGAERTTNMLGYLLQQDAVISSRPQLSGSGHYFQILEPGGKTLEDPEKVRTFWNAFRDAYPKAEGFMPVKTADGSGISILKVRGHFNDKEVAALQSASEKAADSVKIAEIKTKHGNADIHMVSNDWKEQPNGEGYTRRLDEIGRPGLQQRLQREFGPSVEKAIRDAYQRHAQALGGEGKVTQ